MPLRILSRIILLRPGKFSLNHELYKAFYQAIGVYINTNVQMSKTAAVSCSSLALNFFNQHRPKWTEQELPT